MRSKLSILVLALMACGAANAAMTSVGEAATVQASVAVNAQNTVSATWTQDPSLSGSSIRAMQKLGTLSIQLTGSHAGVHITGDNTAVSGGIVTIPFKNAQGVNYFRGRTDGSIPQLATITVGSHTGPGWRVANTANSINVDFKAFQNVSNIPAGAYTATFYVQQYQI